MKKTYLLFVFVAFATYGAYAQQVSPSIDTLGKTVSKQTTGNSNDVLTTLLRAGVNNLLGKATSFELHPTFYGIDSIFNTHNRSNVDTLYKKQRWLRNFQLDLAVKADSTSNKITTFSGGLTISLIDKRDVTHANFSTLQDLFNRFENLRKDLNLTIAEGIAGKQQATVMEELEKSWDTCDKKHDYSTLDPRIKAALAKRSQADQDLIMSGKDNIHAAYTNLAAVYAKKALLTAAPNYSYNSISKQSAFKVTATFLDGIGNSADGKEWELQANSSFAIQGDSTIAGPNLKNRPLTISSGVNKVLALNKDKVSTCELKGYFAYTDQLGTITSGQQKQTVTFNTTFRVKVLDTFWVPLTLSYNIKHPNLLSFLSFTANID
jgi:hypothetical protein